MATDIRLELRNVMLASLTDEAANHNWYYSEIRPLGMPTKLRQFVGTGVTKRGDCSKGCQWLCWWVPGCPDPMKNGFGVYGNSQTIWLYSQHVDHPSELEIGDIITFGYNGDQHAAMVLEAGSDPLLWSFGHQGAPNTYRLSQDGRPAQYCKLPISKYVPTPDDRLRARTGWFAWVAWKLGEGDWYHKGKANPRVRPSVPKRIPLGWWKRYADFLLNRKKGNKPS